MDFIGVQITLDSKISKIRYIFSVKIACRQKSGILVFFGILFIRKVNRRFVTLCKKGHHPRLSVCTVSRVLVGFGFFIAEMYSTAIFLLWYRQQRAAV